MRAGRHPYHPALSTTARKAGGQEARFVALMLLLLLALGIISSAFILSKGIPAGGRPLVVLGSGGHTGEMLAMLANLRLADRPNFVFGEGDALSVERARKAGYGDCEFLALPRARRVGQGLVSSAFSTLQSLWKTLFMIAKARPKLVLCNGPGTCVVVAAVVRLFQLQTSTIYVESLARVKTLSLSGKIMYNFGLCNRFLVQWPELVKEYPQAEYMGLLV